MKEKLCYVALDSDDDSKEEKEEEFELPDGEIISIGDARFRAPEAMFRPRLVGVDASGIDRMVYNSIVNCDADIRNDLYKNVVVSGGNSLLPNFAERIQRSVDSLSADSVEVEVSAAPDRKYAVWIGGSLLASLSTFEEKWITSQEYEEEGSSVVHRKCECGLMQPVSGEVEVAVAAEMAVEEALSGRRDLTVETAAKAPLEDGWKILTMPCPVAGCPAGDVYCWYHPGGSRSQARLELPADYPTQVNRKQQLRCRGCGDSSKDDYANWKWMCPKHEGCQSGQSGFLVPYLA